MLNKDDTPALPNHNAAGDPKHTSTPIPSPNNDSQGYITMVPVKFDSPSDKHTRYFLTGQCHSDLIISLLNDMCRLSSDMVKKHKKGDEDFNG